jgi:SAM-dependent methyltransferase
VDRNDWNERYASTDLVWGTEPNRFVAAELEEVRAPGRALDLACGEGRNAIWLAAQGWTVTGVDFSSVAIERGRQLAARRGIEVEWVVADLVTYMPEAAAFDLVLIAYLQLPAEELRAVLRHAATAVAPGGEVLLIGHAAANLSGGVGGPRDPAVLWKPSQIEDALRASAMEVTRCEHVRRPVETPDGPREAIDVLARAHRPASAQAMFDTPDANG